jgi:repressor LexA
MVGAQEERMRELTGKQREVLGFIRGFVAKHGLPPTVREIGERFKVTPRAAFDHLRALERKGMLQRRATAGRTSRSLVPSDGAGGRPHAVPILGRVAAGQPLLAAENREGELHIAPASLPGRGEDVFALRVRGDSMIEAHICDGDLVLVRRQDSAQPNEIVVAMVESESGEAEATVKRFQRDGERVVLKPEHPTMAPIVVDPRRTPVKIIGKVVGLLRGF